MDLSALLPTRSVEDILAERVRLTIGGEEYVLPALSIEQTETWLDGLQTEVNALIGFLEMSGDDGGRIFAELTSKPARLLDYLVSYDQTGVLPDRDVIRRGLTPIGLLRAVLEVWRAANPLVDIGLASMTDLLASVSPPPTSSRRRNGAGRTVKSGAN